MHPIQNDIGAFVAPCVSISPRNAAAETYAGIAVDRLEARSCVLVVESGAPTGAPDSYTLAGKLQHSDTTTDGDFVDFQIDETTVAIETITADGSLKTVNVDLSSAKRYVRAKATLAFVNGSSPKLPYSASIILGGGRKVPLT